MSLNRPFVLSIAGFDPSGGAGLLADIKTFEQNQVYGLGICTSITRQNDSEFFGLNWLSYEDIIEQLLSLINKFAISTIKIGIINSLETLYKVILYIKSLNYDCKIIWDPVIKASAGYDFLSELSSDILKKIINNCYLVTPNYNEMQILSNTLKDSPILYGNILLKGGHNLQNLGTDILYVKDHPPIEIKSTSQIISPKHGSGCVLSSAIAANIAKGNNLLHSCIEGKKYTANFLESNQSLLGYHNHDR